MKKTLAVILTGMGQDGTRGAELVRERGGQVFAQDEESSVVWGMPGFVTRSGLANRGVALPMMAKAIEDAELIDWQVKILATDLSTAVLDRAREGRYRQLEVNRGLPAQYLLKYFDRHGAERQVKALIRDLVEFRQLNLIEPWPSLPEMAVVFPPERAHLLRRADEAQHPGQCAQASRAGWGALPGRRRDHDERGCGLRSTPDHQIELLSRER